MRFVKRLLYAAILTISTTGMAGAEPIWSGPGSTGLFIAEINSTTREAMLVHMGYRDVDGTATWFKANGRYSSEPSLFRGDTESCTGGQPFGGTYRAPTCSVFGYLSVEFASSQNGATYGIDVTKIGTMYLPNDRSKYGTAITPTVVEAGPAGGPAPRNPLKSYYPMGWYWSASEGGTGWFFDVQGDTAFIAVFTYDANGRDTWKISTATMTSETSYRGPLQSYRKVNGVPVSTDEGTLSMTFRTTNPQGVVLIDAVLPNGRQVTLSRFLNVN